MVLVDVVLATRLLSILFQLKKLLVRLDPAGSSHCREEKAITTAIDIAFTFVGNTVDWGPDTVIL